MSRDISILPWDSAEFYQHAHAIAGKRVEFVEHKGKRILTIDSTGANLSIVRAIAAECWRMVSNQELKSVRTLNNLEGAEFSRETVRVMSELVTKNQPFVVRGALIGITGMRFFAYQTVVRLTKRPLKLFETRAEALDWLALDGEE